MSIVRTNPQVDNDAVRQLLFSGELVLFTELPAVAELVSHTRRELEALFHPHDPQQAHVHFSSAQLAEMLSVWKPRFHASAGVITTVQRGTH